MAKRRTKSEKIILSTIGVAILVFLGAILVLGIIGLATKRRTPFEYQGITGREWGDTP